MVTLQMADSMGTPSEKKYLFDDNSELESASPKKLPCLDKESKHQFFSLLKTLKEKKLLKLFVIPFNTCPANKWFA